MDLTGLAIDDLRLRDAVVGFAQESLEPLHGAAEARISAPVFGAS